MQNLEEQHQIMIMQWCKAQRLSELKHPVPSGTKVFDYIVASANGGNRSKATGARLKATGVRAGFPDIQLCLGCGGFYGLFIELKRPRIQGKPTPTVSTLQKEWLLRLRKAHYRAEICYGFDEAIKVITSYLRGDPL